MTTSSWDNIEIQEQFSDCQTLQDIIKRLESEFLLKGEVICEIRVNGVILDDEDEAKFAASRAAEVRALAIRSNRPADLIFDAMTSAETFVPDLEASCLKTSELFRGINLAAAQVSLNECLSGCQWVVDTLMHVRGAASGIGKPIHQPERWYQAEKMITQVIRELSEAYSAKDFVLVADLLEYELTSSLTVWKDVLVIERSTRVQP